MITNLEKYRPTLVPTEDGSSTTFLFPMTGARDVLLADLATEMTNSDNRFYFGGDYWSSKGPDKFYEEYSGVWYARILGARKESHKNGIFKPW